MTRYGRHRNRFQAFLAWAFSMDRCLWNFLIVAGTVALLLLVFYALQQLFGWR
jgi:hypothetical protein